MAKVSLDRMTDGRHVVMDAQGNAIGVHNSLRSAQRQIQDYYEPATAASGAKKLSGNQQVSTALEQIAGQTPAGAGTIENPAAAQAAMQQQLMGQQQLQDQAHHQMLQQAGVNPMAQAAQQVLDRPSALQAYQKPDMSMGQMDQQKANVNLVNQRANGPWQGGGDPAQLQAAWSAFHPQGPGRG